MAENALERGVLAPERDMMAVRLNAPVPGYALNCHHHQRHIHYVGCLFAISTYPKKAPTRFVTPMASIS